tara:strand:- start:213 stop:632 length:420 start_codon:yes stop_codon:yes gene_type:complete
MATLTNKLTLTGTAADFGQALSFNYSKDMTVQKPWTGISRLKIDATSAEDTVLDAIDSRRFVYIKHTGLDSAGAATTEKLYIEVDDGDQAGVPSERIGYLKSGEWCFFPLDDTDGTSNLVAETSAGDVIIEYAYWTVED